MKRLLMLVSLCVIALSGVRVAGADEVTYTAPEVTNATLHCKAAWNEFCEDQKVVTVPDGFRLCQHDVSVTAQDGDSHYDVTQADEHGITVSFSAKGNRKRLEPAGAAIDLAISLKGVPADDDCANGKTRIIPTATNIDQPPAVETAPVPPPTPEILKVRSTPRVVAKPAPETTPVQAPPGAKVNACACSQMIEADKVSRCLAQGQTREHASCDTLDASIDCVASKDECHKLQNTSCYQALGMDQSMSQKRIYVPDSLYCRAKLNDSGNAKH